MYIIDSYDTISLVLYLYVNASLKPIIRHVYPNELFKKRVMGKGWYIFYSYILFEGWHVNIARSLFKIYTPKIGNLAVMITFSVIIA